jgi:DHA2 family multidrug resistance protein
MHNNMTPNTGEDDMYWALILRGIGLDYYLFPSLPYRYLLYLKNIGEGAAFTGMMRQLEVIWYCNHHYFITRFSQEHRVNLVAHLDGTKFEVQQRLQLYKKDLCQKDLLQMKQ